MFEKAEVFLDQRNQLNKEPYIYNNNYKTGRAKSHRMHILTGLRVRYVLGMVALFAVGFIFGRAFLLGELLPFGVALVAACTYVYRGHAWTALIGAVLGLSTVVSDWELAARIMVLVAVGMFSLTLPSVLNLNRLYLGGLVFAVLVVAGTGYVAVTGPTTYDYVRVLFEAVFAALLAVAYGTALGGIRRYNSNSGRQLNGEQAFCFIILLLSLVAAAGQVRWGVISPGGIIASLTVLMAGYVGGAGLGAAAGAVIGVVPGLVFTVSPAALGAFAFAGFLGGLCRGLKRIGVLTGFLLGGTILTVYLGSGRDIGGLMLETVLAGLIFLMLPKVVFTALQKNIPVGATWAITIDSAEVEQDSVTGRFRRWEAVCEEISRTYEQVSGSLEPQGKEGSWHDSVNQVKNVVCHDCVLNKVCWEKEAQRTILCLENCFTGALNSGSVTMEDLDKQLRKRCSRLRELVMGINCCFQLWRMQQLLEQKSHKSRELVSLHLRGMRGVIENLARELDANEVWGPRAEYLKQCLKESGIPVAALSLYSGEQGCEADVTVPACSGKRRCVYDVAPFLMRLTDEKLALSCKDCVNLENDDFCTFRLYPGLVYQLKLGLARCAGKANDISGDTCALMHLNGGQLVVLLSDGMGVGAVAASQSKATLTLLQQLLKAGYNRELAIRIVNSVMMEHCPEKDNFATLDISVLDLYSGEFELVKIGAPPSYLVRNNQVQVIQASSLPVGIVDDINIFCRQGNMDNGDMLVMVTDGVGDAYTDKLEDEDWIASVLKEIVELPAQEVAELILRLALSGSNSGGGRRNADDMTVLVMRMETIGEQG